MYMSYKGKYRPENPRKYKGDPTNIIYRSLWERKFMKYCDLNENVNQWNLKNFGFLINVLLMVKFIDISQIFL
jgi:hypothetical protein